MSHLGWPLLSPFSWPMKMATTKTNQEMAPAKHAGWIRAFNGPRGLTGPRVLGSGFYNMPQVYHQTSLYLSTTTCHELWQYVWKYLGPICAPYWNICQTNLWKITPFILTRRTVCPLTNMCNCVNSGSYFRLDAFSFRIWHWMGSLGLSESTKVVPWLLNSATGPKNA